LERASRQAYLPLEAGKLAGSSQESVQIVVALGWLELFPAEVEPVQAGFFLGPGEPQAVPEAESHLAAIDADFGKPGHSLCLTAPQVLYGHLKPMVW
jgi:hypothetical protein